MQASTVNVKLCDGIVLKERPVAHKLWVYLQTKDDILQGHISDWKPTWKRNSKYSVCFCTRTRFDYSVNLNIMGCTTLTEFATEGYGKCKVCGSGDDLLDAALKYGT